MNIAPTRLSHLPLFPLRTVLFPGGVLPLRIFEVRYLDMMARAHKAGSPFGVVCLTQGSEVQQPSARSGATASQGAVGFADESFHPVGTLAHIHHLTQPQPGLLTARCAGSQRFRITHSRRLAHGLWVADVDLLEPDTVVPVPLDLASTSDTLQQLVGNLEQRIDNMANMPLQLPYHWNDCGWLANRWCELLPLGPETQQRFMSLDNPLLRLELVADALDEMGLANSGSLDA